MNRAGYVVEHPSRGVLMSLDQDPAGMFSNAYGGWSSRWSWSRPRSDGQTFASVHDAAEAVGRLKPAVADLCAVLERDTWTPVRFR
jgi:hypothetical protein